jgi:hypothetical protein
MRKMRGWMRLGPYAEFTLVGVVQDPEWPADRHPELFMEWSSDKEGVVGYGDTVYDVRLHIFEFSGDDTHTIRLRATDRDGRVNFDTIQVNIYGAVP